MCAPGFLEDMTQQAVVKRRQAAEPGGVCPARALRANTTCRIVQRTESRRRRIFDNKKRTEGFGHLSWHVRPGNTERRLRRLGQFMADKVHPGHVTHQTGIKPRAVGIAGRHEPDQMPAVSGDLPPDDVLLRIRQQEVLANTTAL